MCTSRASYRTQIGAGILEAFEEVYRHRAAVNSQSERWTENGSTVPRLGAKYYVATLKIID